MRLQRTVVFSPWFDGRSYRSAKLSEEVLRNHLRRDWWNYALKEGRFEAHPTEPGWRRMVFPLEHI